MASPTVQTTNQVVEAVLVEQYISVLLFKPKNWVMCPQPATLEEAMMLMEAYVLVVVGSYLVPKVWKVQMEK